MSTLQASSSKSSNAGAALRRAAEEAIAAGSAKWAKKAREEAERRAAVMEGGPPRMSKALIITDKFGNPIDFTKIKSKSASSSTASSKTIVAAAAVGDVAGDVKKSLYQLAPPSSKSNAKEAITTGMANKTSDKTERTEYNSTALSTQNGTMIKEEEERADAVLDGELTALLRMWDLEDAAEALAEHGWKSVSRLKHFKRNKHMEELDLPSGTVCALEAMLQSIPSDVFVNNLSGETLNVDVMPPDTHDALISAIPSRLNDLDKAFVSIKTYRDTLQCKQDLVLEMNEARSEEVKLVEEKIKSKIMLGNQKVALTVQQTDIERNISTELLEKKRNLKKKIIDLNNENNIDNNHDYDAYAFKPLSRDDAETRKR